MLFVSLIINITVLIPICYFMLTNNTRIVKTLGEFSPARGILFAIYIMILTVSVYLLIFPNKEFIVALLSMQVIYKILTPFTVKTLKHSFVISNILIAIVHTITLSTTFFR